MARGLQAPDLAEDWLDLGKWFAPGDGVSFMNRAGQVGAIAGIMAAEESRLFAFAPDMASRTAVISGSWIAGWPSATAALCEGLRKRPVEIYPSTAFDNGCHLGSIILCRRYGITGLTTTFCGDVASGLQAMEGAARVVRHGYVDAAMALSYDVTHRALQAVGESMPAARVLVGLRDGASAVLFESAALAARRQVSVLAEVRAALPFGHRPGEPGAIERACDRVAESVGGPVRRLVLARPADEGMIALAGALARSLGAVVDLTPDESHSGAAQAMLLLESLLPLREAVLLLAGQSTGAKVAIVLDPPPGS
jgi:hypothetical protein